MTRNDAVVHTHFYCLSNAWNKCVPDLEWTVYAGEVCTLHCRHAIARTKWYATWRAETSQCTPLRHATAVNHAAVIFAGGRNCCRHVVYTLLNLVLASWFVHCNRMIHQPGIIIDELSNSFISYLAWKGLQEYSCLSLGLTLTAAQCRWLQLL